MLTLWFLFSISQSKKSPSELLYGTPGRSSAPPALILTKSVAWQKRIFTSPVSISLAWSGCTVPTRNYCCGRWCRLSSNIPCASPRTRRTGGIWCSPPNTGASGILRWFPSSAWEPCLGSSASRCCDRQVSGKLELPKPHFQAELGNEPKVLWS